MIIKLNIEQRQIYDEMIVDVFSKKPSAFFIHDHDGTGKPSFGI